MHLQSHVVVPPKPMWILSWNPNGVLEIAAKQSYNSGKVFGTAVVRMIMDFSGTKGSLQTVSSETKWSVSYSLLQGSRVT